MNQTSDLVDRLVLAIHMLETSQDLGDIQEAVKELYLALELLKLYGEL